MMVLTSTSLDRSARDGGQGNRRDATLEKFAEMAKSDPSPVVRLYLASALQRMPAEKRWPILEGLLTHAEDADDPNIPLIVWYGAEPLAEVDPSRAPSACGRNEAPKTGRIHGAKGRDARDESGDSRHWRVPGTRGPIGPSSRNPLGHERSLQGAESSRYAQHMARTLRQVRERPGPPRSIRCGHLSGSDSRGPIGKRNHADHPGQQWYTRSTPGAKPWPLS